MHYGNRLRYANGCRELPCSVSGGACGTYRRVVSVFKVQAEQGHIRQRSESRELAAAPRCAAVVSAALLDTDQRAQVVGPCRYAPPHPAMARLSLRQRPAAVYAAVRFSRCITQLRNLSVTIIYAFAYICQVVFTKNYAIL